MKFIKSISSLGLCFLLIPLAFASPRWTLIGTSKTKDTLIVYEANSIKTSPEGITAWLAWVNDDPRLDFDLVIDSWSIKCSVLKYRSEQPSFYHRGKWILDTDRGEWKLAPPGSVAEAIVNHVCKRTPSNFVYKENDRAGLTIWGKWVLKHY